MTGFCVVSLSVLFASSAPPAVDTWPQWRGPDRSGVIAGAKPWPKQLKGDALSEVWKVNDLGPSYSGPIIGEDRVFTTETIDKKTEEVTAFDRKTGKPIWKQKWDGSIAVPFFAAANGSWIRATPAYDGESLYVAGIRDLLVCLNATTGDVRWKIDLAAKYESGVPAFGCASSPLVDKDAVYVQAGGGVVKIEKKTGKVIWRVLESKDAMSGSAFSSPVLGTFGTTEALVVQTRSQLAGLDRATGKILWSREVPSFRGMNILTPTQFGDGFFTSTYGGNTQLFNVRSSAEGYRVEDGWAFKYEGNMSSPVIVKDHAYLLGKDQRLICVNLKTGKQTWRTEKSFGKYWSLIANGDTLLGLDQKGILYLFEANPEQFELLDERKISDSESWAHLAIAGENIVVRDLNRLTAFTWSAKK